MGSTPKCPVTARLGIYWRVNEDHRTTKGDDPNRVRSSQRHDSDRRRGSRHIFRSHSTRSQIKRIPILVREWGDFIYAEGVMVMTFQVAPPAPPVTEQK